MDIIQWLITQGTNEPLMGFVDNNSILVLGGWGLLMLVLKHRAKKTPSPDDDELIESIDSKVRDLFHRSVQKRV